MTIASSVVMATTVIAIYFTRVTRGGGGKITIYFLCLIDRHNEIANYFHKYSRWCGDRNLFPLPPPPNVCRETHTLLLSFYLFKYSRLP